MTAYESHLANAEERREYAQGEPAALLDAADVLSHHQRLYDECSCEMWNWREETHSEHVAFVLDNEGSLRDDRPAERWKALAEQLCAEVARLKGMSIEQVRAAHGMTS